MSGSRPRKQDSSGGEGGDLFPPVSRKELQRKRTNRREKLVATTTICRRSICAPRFTFGRASHNIQPAGQKILYVLLCTKIGKINTVIPQTIYNAQHTNNTGQASGTHPNSIFTGVLGSIVVGEKRPTNLISQKRRYLLTILGRGERFVA